MGRRNPRIDELVVFWNIKCQKERPITTIGLAISHSIFKNCTKGTVSHPTIIYSDLPSYFFLAWPSPCPSRPNPSFPASHIFGLVHPSTLSELYMLSWRIRMRELNRYRTKGMRLVLCLLDRNRVIRWLPFQKRKPDNMIDVSLASNGHPFQTITHT